VHTLETGPGAIWSEPVSEYAKCGRLQTLVLARTFGFNFTYMLYEPTTLASVARLIGETLESDYNIDPQPIFARLRIDTSKFFRPGARVTFAKMRSLWSASVDATGDPDFGLKVGERAKPGDFFVLGHAWLASATVAGALNRMCRYSYVVSTAYRNIEMKKQDDGNYLLTESWPDKSNMPPLVAKDGGYVALLKLCDAVAKNPVRPIRVSLTVPSGSRKSRYEELFQCPIEYDSDQDIYVFDAADLDEPLTGSIPEVATATDRIAERYIESLDESRVSTSVRQLLVQMLPSGKADQDRIAKRLYRSTSTLQRQLHSEGTNYRHVLESTRRELAEQYLKEGDFSQAQIAFMVGFADQSNFARAFKRWTGMSPGEYQKAA
jgi:AraC-like DNA-binding protein